MPDADLTWTPGWKLRQMMADKQLSPVELSRHVLERTERYNSELGAFITVFPEVALAGAKAAEQAFMRGEDLGLLHGLPISVKDQIWTKGQRTTLASKLFADFVPDKEAVASERLKAAGATIFAKANMPEFSMARRSLNLLAGEALNPWDPERQRSTGGSSGGSGAATAAGLGPISIGTDGGGSIRIPSAFNGIFGLYPSRGRVPNGAGFYNSLLSGIGPMTRDVRDAATVMQVIAGVRRTVIRSPWSKRHPIIWASLKKASKGCGSRGLRIWAAFSRNRQKSWPSATKRRKCSPQLGCIYDEPGFRLEDPFDALERDTEYSPAQLTAQARRFILRTRICGPGSKSCRQSNSSN